MLIPLHLLQCGYCTGTSGGFLQYSPLFYNFSSGVCHPVSKLALLWSIPEPPKVIYFSLVILEAYLHFLQVAHCAKCNPCIAGPS